MKKKQAWCLAAALLAAGPGFAADAAKDAQAKPAVVEAAAGSVTAIVEEIDYTTRKVTLRGPKGDLIPMEVGPDAIRFNEVKKGDEVQVDYLESVAVVVQSPDAVIESGEGSKSMIVRNKGKKPSGTLVQTDVVTATVEKINAKKRTATLRGPTGDLMDLNVAPDVTNLENVKKGDQVLVKRTRTVAIDVRKPAKK